MAFKKGTSGNPGGRPRKSRTDSWTNQHSGYGTSRDRRTATRHLASIVSDEEAVDLWTGNDVAAKAIEAYPQDAIRGGYEIQIGDDKEAGDEVEAAVTDLDGDVALTDALEYERAYGGSAIWPVILGSEPDLALPLNPSRCVALEKFMVLEPRELQPLVWDDGEVEVWRVVPMVPAGPQPPATYLHRSRLIYFPGIRVSKRPTPGHRFGHGHSILTRMAEVLKDFGITWASAGALLHGFAQGVLSIEGLAGMLGSGGGQDAFMARLAAMEMAASSMQTMVVDSKDTFKREATPLNGMSDMLDRFAQRLASAVGMPVTKLMGMSPAGMNATGEGDSRNWYDQVAAYQVDRVQKPLEELLEFVMLCREGPTGGQIPEQWSVDWCPLWEPSQAEVIKMRLDQANVDKIYYDLGAIDADEIAHNRWSGDKYSFETRIDWDARARLEPVAPGPVNASKPDPVVPPPPAGGDGEDGAPPPEEDAKDPGEKAAKADAFDPDQPRV